MAATLLIVHRVVVSNRLRNFAPSNTHTAQLGFVAQRGHDDREVKDDHRPAQTRLPHLEVNMYPERAADTGAQIRGYHETIKGVDGAGRRYHAVNPETFYWAHATFFMLIIKTAEYLCGGLPRPRRANCSTNTCSGTGCTA